MRKISNRCDLGRDFSACVDTRKKIVAIQIALFSACGDTRKNSRDLNRDSNRAFLVCGNGPIIIWVQTRAVCVRIARSAMRT